MSGPSRSGNLPSPAVAIEESSARGLVRVLHINAGNLYGGVESILVTLARFRSACPAMASHFALCHEGRLSNELKDAAVPVYLLGGVRISRPWTIWRARRRLRRLLRLERFDLVICHMPWSLAVFGKAVRDTHQRLGFWAHGFHTGRSWLERLALRMPPDLAIANSHFTETGLSNLFPASPRTVIYPPVGLNAGPAGTERSKVREQLGAGEDTVVIIQVGRMEAWKGHALHLEALAQLKVAAKWTCWMVGGAQTQVEEEYFAKLEKMAGQLGIAGQVRFLGQRSDVAELLAAADIFCQPNAAPEPFGIVFVEALRAGRPVVSTALGGALEIVDQSCGLLVVPDSPDALAAALEQLILNLELRARLSGGGTARAAELCDPATQMKRLMEFSRAPAFDRPV